MNSISCPKCGFRSFNPNDVAYRYCGNCHEFHDLMNLGKLEEGTQHRKPICVLCNKLIDPKTDPTGHNPWPLAKRGRCCRSCNQDKVIPARIAARSFGEAYKKGTFGVIDESQAL